MTAIVAPVETESALESERKVCGPCAERGCELGPAKVVVCLRTAHREGEVDAESKPAYFGCDGTGHVRTRASGWLVPCPNCHGEGRRLCQCLLCHP